MALFDPGETVGRVGFTDRALTVPATPLRVDGPTGFDPSRTDFTLADVLAWARTKPADEAYDYYSNGGCACCQFLRETGRASRPIVDAFTWRDGLGGKRIELERRIDIAAQADTFGEFADRLEQALAR